jgi:hypothetical protein
MQSGEMGNIVRAASALSHRKSPEKTSAGFWVVVEDDTDRTFAIVGPLKSDAGILKQVALARKQGRNVSCCTVSSDRDLNALTWSLTRDRYVESRKPRL